MMYPVTGKADRENTAGSANAAQASVRDIAAYDPGIALEILRGGGVEVPVGDRLPVREALKEIAAGTGNHSADFFKVTV